jgi:hypothetical protein
MAQVLCQKVADFTGTSVGKAAKTAKARRMLAQKKKAFGAMRERCPQPNLIRVT